MKSLLSLVAAVLLYGVAVAQTYPPPGGQVSQSGQAPATKPTPAWTADANVSHWNRICDWFGGFCAAVEPDGAVLVRPQAIPPQIITARSGCAAVNTTATLTITPPAGQSVYITHLYLSEWQDGTGGTETSKVWTLTNLATVTLDYTFSAATAANSYLVIADEVGAPLFKSLQPGAAVVITSPAAATDNGLCTLVSYYFGP